MITEENQQQKQEEENQQTGQEQENKNTEETKPKENQVENTKTNKNFFKLYNAAKEDIEGLGPIGRIMVAVIVIIIIFKLTPIADLLYLFFQICIFPVIFLVAFGVFSKESYDMLFGWIDSTILWMRKKREEEQESK